MNRSVWIGLIGGLAVIGATLGGYALWQPDAQQTATTTVPAAAKTDGQGAYKEFVLEAKESNWVLKEGLEVPAWTYNGTVPGGQVRVTEGDRVKVVLNNSLSEPVSIHWHGYPVPNAMDGIPGVTQNAVKPGESFTYEFVATVPGTYWYHSHQDGANQVDRGLYGTLVVEPKQPTVTYDRDYTLVLDEWNPQMFGATAEKDKSSTDHSGHDMGNSNTGAGMDHSGHDMSGMNGEMTHDAMMKMMYNVYTVNGKAGSDIGRLEVTKGERVKLRFINAGFMRHRVHLQGHPYRITHTDGQAIADAPLLEGAEMFEIAPGERYDIEFVADGTPFTIDYHDEAEAARELKIPVVYTGDLKAVDREADGEANPALVDISRYGKGDASVEQPAYDIEKHFVLDSKKDSNGNEVYTINGKTFPDTEPVNVKKGQQVKFTLTNPGTSDHPMHLHGHFFRVLSKDGKAVSGAPLLKDTLNVRPGETYEIAFTADNDGNWMLHCHDLHHAAAGMMTHVNYDGFTPSFTPDPTAGNNPE